MVIGDLLPRADSPISYKFSFICFVCVGIPGENILLSIVLAFRLDGRKRFEYSACGPVFFLANREKNILRFQKYLDACGYVIIFSGLMIDSVSIPGCPVVPAVLFTWVTSTVAHYHRNIHSLFGT